MIALTIFALSLHVSFEIASHQHPEADALKVHTPNLVGGGRRLSVSRHPTLGGWESLSGSPTDAKLAEHMDAIRAELLSSHRSLQAKVDALSAEVRALKISSGGSPHPRTVVADPSLSRPRDHAA